MTKNISKRNLSFEQKINLWWGHHLEIKMSFYIHWNDLTDSFFLIILALDNNMELHHRHPNSWVNSWHVHELYFCRGPYTERIVWRCHGCLFFLALVMRALNKGLILDHQMSLRKRKFYYSANCLCLPKALSNNEDTCCRVRTTCHFIKHLDIQNLPHPNLTFTFMFGYPCLLSLFYPTLFPQFARLIVCTLHSRLFFIT
jgi:hypothetical protein